MELSQWFDSQFHSSMEGFVWAVQQLPAERLQIVPPIQLGAWSAAQHVFHMLDYEERFVLPIMARCVANID